MQSPPAPPNSSQQPPSNPYGLFLDAIAKLAPESQTTYIKSLAYYRDRMGYGANDHAMMFYNRTPNDIYGEIREFFKKEGMKYSMIAKCVYALRKFFYANQVLLDWDYIYTFMPAQDETEQTLLPPYSKDNIKAFLEVAEPREKVSAGLMYGGGFRIGALVGKFKGKNGLEIQTGIKLSDIIAVEIEGYKFYAVQGYSYSPRNAYWTGTPPQVSKFIQEYAEETKKKDRSEYLFVNEYDRTKPASKGRLVNSIYETRKKAGIESDAALDHGFRKFFSTQCEVSGLLDEHIDRLMGWGKGKKGRLKMIYSQPKPEEVMRLTNYVKAIPNLTI